MCVTVIICNYMIFQFLHAATLPYNYPSTYTYPSAYTYPSTYTYPGYPYTNTRPYYYGQRRAGIIGRRRFGGRRIFDRTDTTGRFGDHTDTTGGFGIRDRIGRRRRIGGINNPYYY